MPRQIKFEEEVGEIEEGLLSGTFDEVILNISRARERIMEGISLAEGEELVLDFDPFGSGHLLVYRRTREQG